MNGAALDYTSPHMHPCLYMMRKCMQGFHTNIDLHALDIHTRMTIRPFHMLHVTYHFFCMFRLHEHGPRKPLTHGDVLLPIEMTYFEYEQQFA